MTHKSILFKTFIYLTTFVFIELIIFKTHYPIGYNPSMQLQIFNKYVIPKYADEAYFEIGEYFISINLDGGVRTKRTNRTVNKNIEVPLISWQKSNKIFYTGNTKRRSVCCLNLFQDKSMHLQHEKWIWNWRRAPVQCTFPEVYRMFWGDFIWKYDALFLLFSSVIKYERVDRAILRRWYFTLQQTGDGKTKTWQTRTTF